MLYIFHPTEIQSGRGYIHVTLGFAQTGAVNAIPDAGRHVVLCVLSTFVVNLDEIQWKAICE
jgi:hypothetical protein